MHSTTSNGLPVYWTSNKKFEQAFLARGNEKKKMLACNCFPISKSHGLFHHDITNRTDRNNNITHWGLEAEPQKADEFFIF